MYMREALFFGEQVMKRGSTLAAASMYIVLKKRKHTRWHGYETS